MEAKEKLRKHIPGIMVILLLISIFPSAFNIQLVKAEGGTIYIKADGSVDPSTAPIQNVGNVYYTLTADIHDQIVIQRSNIIVDGNGYMLNGSGSGNGLTYGFSLSDINNVTIKKTTIINYYAGIYIYDSGFNTLSGNNVTKNSHGILLYFVSGHNVSGNTVTFNYGHGINIGLWSNGNTVSNNTATGNHHGIVLTGYSDGNRLSGNTVTNNDIGICLEYSDGNMIYHNNLLNNTIQAEIYYSTSVWDDGYPSGGNFWSNYTGIDLHSGPNQDQPGSDGIGDTPHVIDANNRDNYPLMNPLIPTARLVVRGLNDRIYYRSYNFSSGSWGDWNVLPGATIDSPAAAVCDNELHVVVRGVNNNQLWHGYVNLISGAFSSWTLLSGSTPSAPTLTSNGTALSLVVRGQNNLIYYRFYDCASQTWTGWAALPSGATCDGPAATLLANKLHIVVRGMDGYSIWHSSVDLSTQAFSGWQLVGGATESKPTLTTCLYRNEICLVVRGLNNVIYRNAWSGSSWAGWVAFPSGATCDGIGATVTGEALQVVVRGMDGYSLWHGSVDLATGSFSGWTWISGSTPSKPTLTN